MRQSLELAADLRRSLLSSRLASPPAATTTTATAEAASPQSDFAPVDRAARRRREGRHARGRSPPRDVDYLDPGAAYYQFTYMLGSRPTATLVGWPPDETEEPQPDLRRGSPRSPRTARRSPSRSGTGVKFSPPVDREVTRGRLQVRDRARAAAGRRQRLHVEPTSATIDGYDAGAEGGRARTTTVAPDISGVAGARRPTLVIKLTEPTSRRSLQALSLPDRRPGAGGVREGVRRREPLDVRRAPGRDRPLHDRERRPRAS